MTDAVLVTMNPVSNEKLGLTIRQMIIDPNGNTHELRGNDQDPNKMMGMLITGLSTMIRRLEMKNDVKEGEIMKKTIEMLNAQYVETDSYIKG